MPLLIPLMIHGILSGQYFNSNIEGKIEIINLSLACHVYVLAKCAIPKIDRLVGYKCNKYSLQTDFFRDSRWPAKGLHSSRLKEFVTTGCE